MATRCTWQQPGQALPASALIQISPMSSAPLSPIEIANETRRQLLTLIWREQPMTYPVPPSCSPSLLALAAHFRGVQRSFLLLAWLRAWRSSSRPSISATSVSVTVPPARAMHRPSSEGSCLFLGDLRQRRKPGRRDTHLRPWANLSCVSSSPAGERHGPAPCLRWPGPSPHRDLPRHAHRATHHRLRNCR